MILSHCAWEPFGVLGKLLQNERRPLCQFSTFPQNTRSGSLGFTQSEKVLTGAFRGPGKTHTNEALPYKRCGERHTKITVRIPGAPARTREPFGVLGKLTQLEPSIFSDVRYSHKYHGQDYPWPNFHSERHPAGANPREGCRLRALKRPKKFSISKKPVNCPGLYSASCKNTLFFWVFRGSLIIISHKTHGGR